MAWVFIDQRDLNRSVYIFALGCSVSMIESDIVVDLLPWCAVQEMSTSIIMCSQLWKGGCQDGMIGGGSCESCLWATQHNCFWNVIMFMTLMVFCKVVFYSALLLYKLFCSIVKYCFSANLFYLFLVSVFVVFCHYQQQRLSWNSIATFVFIFFHLKFNICLMCNIVYIGPMPCNKTQ